MELAVYCWQRGRKAVRRGSFPCIRGFLNGAKSMIYERFVDEHIFFGLDSASIWLSNLGLFSVGNIVAIRQTLFEVNLALESAYRSAFPPYIPP
jgi:hypothetical protein